MLTCAVYCNHPCLCVCLFVGPPYYSQRTMFASPLIAFSLLWVFPIAQYYRQSINIPISQMFTITMVITTVTAVLPSSPLPCHSLDWTLQLWHSTQEEQQYRVHVWSYTIHTKIEGYLWHCISLTITTQCQQCDPSKSQLTGSGEVH